MRNVTRKVAMAVAGIAMSALSAGAQSSGFLNVVGQLQVSSTPGATTPLNIDFLSGGAFPPGTVGFGVPGNVFAGTSLGIFSALTGTAGTMQDIAVLGGGTSTVTVPAGSTLLQIGGYTFNFGVAPASGGTAQFGPIALEQTATGVDTRITLRSTVTGGACTPFCTYDGILTAQFAGSTVEGLITQINSGTPSPVVTFSANFNAAVIPEPSTYVLLATGIGALGLVARRRRTNV